MPDHCRQRPRSCGSVRLARTRTANLVVHRPIHRFVPTPTTVLRAKAIASTAPARPPSDQRRGQFPIALAAPSVPYPPQFRALALFGRRPPERVVGIVGAGIRKPAQDSGGELLGEDAGLRQKLLTFRRSEPCLKVGFGVETHDGKPMILHAWYRRLEAMALEAGSPGLCGRNAPRPSAMSVLLPGLDARRHDRRARARQHAGVAASDDVDVVATDQHRSCALEPLLPLFRIEPRNRCLLAAEPLQDDTVALRR